MLQQDLFVYIHSLILSKINVTTGSVCLHSVLFSLRSMLQQDLFVYVHSLILSEINVTTGSVCLHS